MDLTPSHSHEYDIQTDAKLWAALCSGEIAALGQIYDRHAGLVYGISLRMLGSAQEAEDLTQDVFIELVENKRYDPARGSLRTFLLMLTRSRATDRLRSRQTSQRSTQKLRNQYSASEKVTADLPVENALGHEQSETIRAALQQLSASQQQALQLAYYEGLSQSDIASRLNTPLGTIKARTRRGLLKLRAILSPRPENSIQTQHEQEEREQ